MTTTTPESRARIAYISYHRARYGVEQAAHELTLAPFDNLPEHERAGWMKAADTLWTLATTGRAEI